jgi:DNA polymerase I-like protein with 3'-5' exonuclease and polymerase domains
MNRVQVTGAYQQIAYTHFNPGSRQHCAKWLSEFGWIPDSFTSTGSPKVDEESLERSTLPQAQLLKRYFKLSKEYGLLYKGDNSIFNCLDNRVIRHHCISHGANTGRMSHSSPNLSQTPSTEAFRGLYIAPEGFSIVGADMDAQELRILAHYLFDYDGGKYAKAVLEGKKEDKTDIHSINQSLAELATRDEAKTLIYAILYGASDIKIGYQVTNNGFVLPDITRDEFDYISIKINKRAVTKNGVKLYPIENGSWIKVTDELIH